MKNIFFLIAVTFVCLAVAAQSFKADVSITSMTVAPYNPRITTGTIGITPKNDLPVVSTTTERKISIPGKEEPPPPFYTCSIIVHNGNDGPAKGTTLIVVVPAMVSAGGGSPSIKTITGIEHSEAPGYTAYVEFKLGDVKEGQDINIVVIYNRPAFAPNKISAFVFNSVTDPNPLNNYKGASL